MYKAEADKLAYFLNPVVLLFHDIVYSQVGFVFPSLARHHESHDKCFNQIENSNYGSNQNRSLACLETKDSFIRKRK